jgi:hypothetical protein
MADDRLRQTVDPDRILGSHLECQVFRQLVKKKPCRFGPAYATSTKDV